MMFGFDPISATGGIILAGLTACNHPSPAVVAVEFIYTPPVYSQTMSMAQMTASVKNGGTHLLQETSRVGGWTKSDFSLNYGISFGGMADSKTGSYCVWVDEVNIKISYAPVISIVTDFAPGSCWYYRTMAHELRHVDATLKTAQEYKPYLRQVAERTAQGVDPVYPVPATDIPVAQKYLAERFTVPIKKAGTKMMESENLRQQAVDQFEMNKTLTTDCAMGQVK